MLAGASDSTPQQRLWAASATLLEHTPMRRPCDFLLCLSPRPEALLSKPKEHNSKDSPLAAAATPAVIRRNALGALGEGATL